MNGVPENSTVDKSGCPLKEPVISELPVLSRIVYVAPTAGTKSEPRVPLKVAPLIAIGPAACNWL